MNWTNSTSNYWTESTEKHTAVSNDPENNQFLSPVNFKFILKRAPNLNFFLQKVNLPRINIPPAKEPTPFADRWLPGVDVVFDPLNITFRVDEDLKNWKEIYNWSMALGEAKSLHPYRHLELKPTWTGEGVFSDITVTILDSLKNPNITFYYHDCFPISISQVMFDATPNAINHAMCEVSFRYINFDIETVV